MSDMQVALTKAQLKAAEKLYRQQLNSSLKEEITELACRDAKKHIRAIKPKLEKQIIAAYEQAIKEALPGIIEYAVKKTGVYIADY